MEYITLNHKVTLYIPSTHGSKPASRAEFTARTNKAGDLFTGLFGGASIEAVKGFYKDRSGQYITEDINKVVSYCSEDQLTQYTGQVLNTAREYCKSWDQETIGLEIDNNFILVH